MIALFPKSAKKGAGMAKKYGNFARGLRTRAARVVARRAAACLGVVMRTSIHIRALLVISALALLAALLAETTVVWGN